MLDYCPNCKCKIKFYKAHECEKMKHDLADSVKLAGDVIASSDDCKIKENTANGFFRIWCVLRNIIEIICDIIKRLRCVQKKAKGVCEAQHCIANRIEEVNRFIGAVNEGARNTPDASQQEWEEEKNRLMDDYNSKLSAYNIRKSQYEMALSHYNSANSNYASALQAYNQRKADWERRKKEYEAGQGTASGATQWQTAWGTFQRSGPPYDVAMGGAPSGNLHGMDLNPARKEGYGKGIGFTSKNAEGTSVDIQLNLVGYAYRNGKYGPLGSYVQYGGTYDWYLDLYTSKDGGKTYQALQKNILLAKHADTQKLAYTAGWQKSTIKWSKTFNNLPSNFTHLKAEVRGDEPGDRHQNVYTREQIVRKPFPAFTEKPPTNDAKAPEPFTEQPPTQPTIPPKPEKKIEEIPLIKGGCELLDCRFDCFDNN